LGNSKLYQTGGRIGIGTTSPTAALDVSGRINVSKDYRVAGLTVLAMPGNTGSENISVGYQSLAATTFGVQNTAIGHQALAANLDGSANAACGYQALFTNNSGSYNTAVGNSALASNQYGGSNTAVGADALGSSTTGYLNTADGESALFNNTTGSNNIAVGNRAAINVSGANSNNIHVGNQGVFTDNDTIRIGTVGTHTSLFVSGVRGIITGTSDAIPVVIDSNGQLGTVSSSRRFKEDIQDMGEASRRLMQLRPVTFRYQRPFADGSKPLQYGLVAEEVAEVYPDLVAHSTDGEIEAVKYQVLDSMLLNEVQRQQAEIRSLQEQLAQFRDIKERLNKMEAALASTSH
jgi:hypothetical protein